MLFFIPVMTPMVANVMVWRLLFQPGGLIDSGMQSWFGVSAPNFLGSSNWAMPAIVAANGSSSRGGMVAPISRHNAPMA